MRSIHTASFAEILETGGLSLLVTTYQAGKLVLLRAVGGLVNTHFRTFQTPMGLAARGGRLALGTNFEVWEFHDAPAIAGRLEPVGRHDACYLPRVCHVTGDIQVHEMAWADSPVSPESGETGDRSPNCELWIVNTRFSCLCTLARDHSFVPRWRPLFITALAPEDRCHLNGVGLVPGAWEGSTPRAYVTALGAVNAAGAWRDNKKNGGILMAAPSGDIVAHGLSMPHSPRWHDGRLWLLESGAGGFGFVDLASGRYQSVAVLPGFTRGLDFFADLAFIGLSQVRETAVFSGIPVAERPLQERCCGVWVVQVSTGQTVAFLKFEDAVQEVFAVQVLPGVRFPDLVNDDPPLLSNSFILPDEALEAVPESLRRGTIPPSARP
jgi:uncharacterized protein (TIGR03032 family)